MVVETKGLEVHTILGINGMVVTVWIESNRGLRVIRIWPWKSRPRKAFKTMTMEGSAKE
jgi:hypothetical protein